MESKPELQGFRHGACASGPSNSSSTPRILLLLFRGMGAPKNIHDGKTLLSLSKYKCVIET